MRLLDLKGKTFNRITVLDYFGKQKWLCQCVCGNKFTAYGHQIKTGHTASCGCLQRERTSKANTKHHYCGTRIYQIWQNMRERCYRKTNQEYHNYGGRGITVCDDWNSSFDKFKDWAFENGYKDDLTIDRVNTNGNYEPTNCRWATRKEQVNNTRRNRRFEFCGITKNIMQWAEMFGINYGTLRDRIFKRKWEFYKCLGFATKEEAQKECDKRNKGVSR